MLKISRFNVALKNQKNIVRFLSNDNTTWRNVLDYWFAPAAESKWFGGGDKVDKEIKEKFGKMVEIAHQGGLKEWEVDPNPSLALIILTDQFSRSIFRGSPRSFDGDERARKITKKFLERRSHDHLQHTFNERLFIYLPLEHSENPEDQILSVSLVEQMAKDAEGTEYAEKTKQFVQFARNHKEIIDMFGRYPQRNHILGRKNTDKEEEFLKNMPDKYKW